MIWLTILLILLILYAWAIRPSLPRRDLGALADHHYAHRGLWNEERPENSLAAFRAAVDKGYGIELDVHRTKDGCLVVHHDDSLKRMTGVDKRIAQCTLAEVRACRLPNGEPVPTYDEVLAVVGGKVPLIVEVKVEGNAEVLSAAVYARMQKYDGPWCVESFMPTAIRWFRRNAPEIIRGQLAFAKGDSTLALALRNLGIASLLQNLLSRPDFVAFEAKTEKWHTLSMRILRGWKPWLVAWTVRSQKDLDALKGRYDLMIFEQFEAQ